MNLDRDIGVVSPGALARHVSIWQRITSVR
jgi:hypothetical protein